MNTLEENRNLEYKVINITWTESNWRRLLELELNEAASEGWAPILSSDGGKAVTVILQRPL